MENTNRIPVRERRRLKAMAKTPFKDSNGDTIRYCRRQRSTNIVQSLLRLLSPH